MVVPNPLAMRLFKLMADKDKLEYEINGYGECLIENGNIGMTGSLIDADGYPRKDIDVYQVRLARQQIICLQNDHKALMKDIEQLMHQLHAGVNAEISLNESHFNSNGIVQKPILKVNSISVGSPAEQAGLRKNDEICEFGSANEKNFDGKLHTIVNIVNHMRDREIPLKVLRNNEILNLILIPKNWSGSGLLGCNIVLAVN